MKIHFRGPRRVKAGTFRTFRIYLSECHIRSGGKIFVALPLSAESGVPNLNAPGKENYTTARVKSGKPVNAGEGPLRTRSITYFPFAPSDLILTDFRFPDGLSKGERLEIVFGDRRFGSPGFRCPKVAGEPFYFWVFPDPEGRFALRNIQPEAPHYLELLDEEARPIPGFHPDSPRVIVEPAVCEHGDLILREKGRRLRLFARDFDAFYNLRGISSGVINEGKRRASVGGKTLSVISDASWDETGKSHTIRVVRGRELSNPIVRKKGGGKNLKVFWGDLHCHSSLSDGGFSTPDDCFRYARDVALLDFCSITDHSFGLACLDHWEKLLQSCRKYNRPGKFITIPGYEIMPHPSGHKNIYFASEEGAELLFADYQRGCGGLSPGARTETYEKILSHDIPRIDDLEKFFDRFEGKDCIISIHHTDRWNQYREGLVRLVEICSEWGISQPGWRQNNSAGVVDDALLTGCRLGIVGGSDNHRGRPAWPGSHLRAESPVRYPAGLTAVYASSLEREAIWEALMARRVYATTGKRILLDFRLNGLPMGSICKDSGGREMSVRVHACSPLDRIDIYRNGRGIHTHYTDALDVGFDFEDRECPAGSCFYLVKVTQIDGEMAWSSPIWVE